MPFQKGEIHTQGGRKTKAEEVAGVIAELKEEITNEALLKLARSKVFKQLNDDKLSDIGERLVAKDFALPITLRGIVDKSEIEHKVLTREMSQEEFEQTMLIYERNKQNRVSEADNE